MEFANVGLHIVPLQVEETGIPKIKLNYINARQNNLTLLGLNTKEYS